MYKKVLALMLGLVMVVGLTACGSSGEEPTDPTKAPTSAGNEATATPVPTEAPAERTDLPEDASTYVNFEDGNYPFAVIAYSYPEADLKAELSVVDFGGSKALQVTRPTGGDWVLAIDVIALLGDNAEKVAKLQYDVGVQHAGGAFAAVSGTFKLFTGEENTETETKWSVYMEDENPKTYTVDLAASDISFANGSTNYILWRFGEDSGANASLLVDNVVFYDASGNVIPTNNAAEFVGPEGITESFWLSLDWSNSVKEPANEVILEGIGGVANHNWWPEDYNMMTFSMIEGTENYYKLTEELFGPGKVMTIYYQDVDGPYEWQNPFLIAQNWAPINNSIQIHPKEDTDDDGNFTADATINNTHTIMQYTYEEIEAACQEAFGDEWRTLVDMLGVADQGSPESIIRVTIGDAQ